MQFLAYIAVVLVSLSGILLELDWLTKPKLETKSPVQIATAVKPAHPTPKVEGPNDGPSPLRAKSEAPPEETAQAAAPAETTGSASPVTPAPEFAATQTDAAPQSNAEAKAVASQLAVAPAAAAQPVPAQPAAAVQTASVQAPNHCDVAACAAAYQSFRAADCTYQPVEGPRKLCEKPAGGHIAAAAAPQSAPKTAMAKPAAAAPRKLSKEAELRDVERVVRRMTARDIDDFDLRAGRGRVIMVEGRDW